ncbi:MAG: hypothetical protein ACJ73J_07660 [Actinomycetes bacterium]
MRYVVRVAMLLAVLCAGIVLPGTAAQACSCMMGDENQYLDWADATFAGEIIDREVVIRDGWDGSAGTHIIYTLSVDRVYKGDVPDVVKLRAGGQGSACGISFGRTGTLLVYALAAKGDASDPVPQYSTSLCSGSHKLSGPPPETIGSDPPVAARPAFDSHLTVTPDEGAGAGVAVAVGAGAVAVVIAAALGVWFWRRRPE